MEYDRRLLEPLKCRYAKEFFTPYFNIDAVLSGREVEIKCPNGCFVLIEPDTFPNGKPTFIFYCADCNLYEPNPPE